MALPRGNFILHLSPPWPNFLCVNVEGMESFPCPWGLYFIHHNRYPSCEMTSFQLSLIIMVTDSTSLSLHSATMPSQGDFSDPYIPARLCGCHPWSSLPS